MKRFISFIMILTISFLLTPVEKIKAMEEFPESFTEGYYEYSVYNGKATIYYVDTSISGSVVVPESFQEYPVTAIGQYAFFRCSNITSLTIGNNITSIGVGAFYECTNLENIIIPNSITVINNETFDSCVNLKDISLPDSVTFIGERAFSGCTNLTSVTLPNNITKISDQTFLSSGLKTIEIPNNVTSIEESAFELCTNLDNVIIPNNVTSIDDMAFRFCENLTNVTIPDSVTSIGDEAFWCCDNVTIYCYENSYAHEYAINNNMAYELLHTSDTEFEIDENGVLVGYYGSSEDIIIPSGVTSIGDEAFYYCENSENIKSITVPDSVLSIGYKAFAWCESLEYVSIGSNVNNIGYHAMFGCHSLTYIDVSSNNTTYKSENGVLYTKDGTEIIQYPLGKPETEYSINNGVKTISNSAFSGCENLESIIIPEGVTSIDTDSFFGCVNLINVHLPETLTYIGNLAFFGCENLENIIIPDSVATIDSNAFEYCINLTNIQLGNNLSILGDGAFSYCENLSDISLADGITSLGYRTFYNTAFYNDSSNWENNVLYIGKYLISALSDIDEEYTVKDGITCIANKAFSGCSDIEVLEIPDSVKYIGDRAFINCSNLKKITIGDALVYLGELAFEYCYNIEEFIVSPYNNTYKSVNGVLYTKDGTSLILYPAQKNDSIFDIPEEVKNIEEWAFTHNYFISSIIIPDSVTTIGDSAFNGCTNLSNVEFGNNVTYIGTVAFGTCISLESITLPNSITTIDISTFFFCTNLASITIPSSVQSIDILAFEDCFELTNVIIPDSVTYISNDAFENCENIIIECKWNSYAHKYALEHNIPFVLSPCIYGDVTGDEKINLTDVSTILKYIAKWDIEMNTDAADVNCDSKVNLTDVSTILKYIAKWDVVLGNTGNTPSEPPSTEPVADVLIISNTQTISNQTIDTDVYITSTGNAIFDNVTINGNIYCYGQLKCSGCTANNVYAYAYGSMMSCAAFDGTHGKVSGGINCNELKILDNALDYAFSKWGKK